ncbi:MAG: hypothetical protein FWB91_09735 [Defluviitaleaceae bacterium]|nr:hypothetical protein [Defluviitaleaceae bacterium]
MNLKKMLPMLLFLCMIIMMAAVGTLAPRMFEDADGYEPSEVIVLYGEPSVSTTGISFYFKNLSESEYHHGLNWRLVAYVNGAWENVPSPPALNIGFVTIIGGGEIRREAVSFIDRHDELTPGRYMFIQGHRPWEWPDATEHLILIEFTIQED